MKYTYTDAELEAREDMAIQHARRLEDLAVECATVGNFKAEMMYRQEAMECRMIASRNRLALEARVAERIAEETLR